MRTQLRVGKWIPDKKISRVEYAQRLIAIMKEVEISLNDHERMTLIENHFDDDIKRTIRLQGIQATGYHYDLLQDFDRIDEKNQLKAEIENKNQGSTAKYKFITKIIPNKNKPTIKK